MIKVDKLKHLIASCDDDEYLTQLLECISTIYHHFECVSCREKNIDKEIKYVESFLREITTHYIKQKGRLQ